MNYKTNYAEWEKIIQEINDQKDIMDMIYNTDILYTIDNEDNKEDTNDSYLYRIGIEE